MSDIIIVGNGTYPEDKGGAAFYMWNLSRCLDNSMFYGWANCKNKNIVTEDKKAMALNIELERRGLIKEGDIIIGDGVWGNYGLNPHKYKLVSVAHGLWNKIFSSSHPLVNIQKIGWNNSRIVVAVSPVVVQDALIHYGVKAKLILTGVDTFFWQSNREYIPKSVLWLSKWNEIKGLKEQVKKGLSDYLHIDMNSFDDNKVLEFYSKASVFVHVTKYEGNSYAILKSLSCGTPVVSSSVGLFATSEYVRDGGLGAVVVPQKENVINAIKEVCDNRNNFYPRKWVEQTSTIDKFKREWINAIIEVINN